MSKKTFLPTSRIQNYKYDVLILGDEMAMKQKELNQQDKKQFKEATKARETLNFLKVGYKNKDKTILAIILNLVLKK